MGLAKLILYFAHPGQRHSHANAAMWSQAQSVEGISRIDLYAEYPTFDVDVDREQQRLTEHEVIVVQCPLFWYSTPALVKEWIDLTLEHGFAYGTGGDKLAGKTLLFALTAAGTTEAYTEAGYQRYPLRTFLTPLEQTAGLCEMRFAAPYVLYGALGAIEDGRIAPHAEGYRRLLTALRDGVYDFEAAAALGVVETGQLDQVIRG